MFRTTSSPLPTDGALPDNFIDHLVLITQSLVDSKPPPAIVGSLTHVSPTTPLAPTTSHSSNNNGSSSNFINDASDPIGLSNSHHHRHAWSVDELATTLLSAAARAEKRRRTHHEMQRVEWKRQRAAQQQQSKTPRQGNTSSSLVAAQQGPLARARATVAAETPSSNGSVSAVGGDSASACGGYAGSASTTDALSTPATSPSTGGGGGTGSSSVTSEAQQLLNPVAPAQQQAYSEEDEDAEFDEAFEHDLIPDESSDEEEEIETDPEQDAKGTNSRWSASRSGTVVVDVEEGDDQGVLSLPLPRFHFEGGGDRTNVIEANLGKLVERLWKAEDQLETIARAAAAKRKWRKQNQQQQQQTRGKKGIAASRGSVPMVSGAKVAAGIKLERAEDVDQKQHGEDDESTPPSLRTLPIDIANSQSVSDEVQRQHQQQQAHAQAQQQQRQQRQHASPYHAEVHAQTQRIAPTLSSMAASLSMSPPASSSTCCHACGRSLSSSIKDFPNHYLVSHAQPQSSAYPLSYPLGMSQDGTPILLAATNSNDGNGGGLSSPEAAVGAFERYSDESGLSAQEELRLLKAQVQDIARVCKVRSILSK